MKRFISLFLFVSVLLLTACTAPTVTRTVTVTSTATPETTPVVTITSTMTSTVTVTTTPPSVVEQAGRLPTWEVGDKWVWSYLMDETTYTLTEEIIGEETVEGRRCYVSDITYKEGRHFLISEYYMGMLRD